MAVSLPKTSKTTASTLIGSQGVIIDMSINAGELTSRVIKPTLEYLGMSSHLAEDILLTTAARQSNFDPFHREDNRWGIYQISSDEHRSVWDDFLAFREDLASRVRGLASQRQFLLNPDQELMTNLAYSTAIAWVSYLQVETQNSHPQKCKTAFQS